MDRYEILERIGEGAFGTVSRARHRKTGRQYAVKCMKVTCSDWSETKQQRELQAILHLCHDCQHLVRVYEIIREKDCRLYFVCEFMPDGDLKDFLATYQKQGKIVEPETVRSIMHQILFGLRHIHSKGFMHRDLKPENLLMSSGRCKVADFSLARQVMSAKPNMTTYVSSRWYRAPELVLEATMYTTAIDMFALGCVMAEMISLLPLFPGRDEHEQLPVILSLLGPLKESEWSEGVRMMEKLQVNLPAKAQPKDIRLSIPQRLARKLNIADDNAISLLDGLLKLNPRHRLSVTPALQHPFFCHTYLQEGSAPEDIRPEQNPLPLDCSFDCRSQRDIIQMQTPMTRNEGITKTTLTMASNRVPLVSISSSTRGISPLVNGFYRDAQMVPGCSLYQGIGERINKYQSPIVPPMVDDHSFFSDSFCLHSEYRPSHAFGIE